MFCHNPKLINWFANLFYWRRETWENIAEIMADLKVRNVRSWVQTKIT